MIEGNKKITAELEETKKKLSDSRKGIEPWNKGKKNLFVSPRKGIPRTEEEKLKMSENRKNIEAWNKNIDPTLSTFYGKKHSTLSKEKMSEARKLYWQKRKQKETEC